VRDPKGVAQQVLRMKGMDFKTISSF